MKVNQAKVYAVVAVLALLPLVASCTGVGGEDVPDGAAVAAAPVVMITPGVNPNPIVELPLVVDSVFGASGYEGDGSLVPASTNMTPHAAGDTETCNRARAPGTPRGTCHIATYNFKVASGNPSPNGWTGVVWQFPSNNWGMQPGANIASGATQIHFFARGEHGGEQVKFGAGGIGTKPFVDSFSVSTSITLTTDWQEYSLPLGSSVYGYDGNGVLGGFMWSIDGHLNNLNTTDQQSLSFYIDDIVWE